jgi:DNA-binding NarL/FixJ family response regulator
MDVNETALTVMMVEDDPVARHRLAGAVAADPGLVLGRACGTVAEALEWLRCHEPDLLLVDLGLPDGSGVEVIAACNILHPRCDILVFSMFGVEANVLASVEAGATGYILKDAGQFDVCRAMQELRAGGSPMSPVIARRLLTRLRGGEGRAAFPGGGATRMPSMLRAAAGSEVAGLPSPVANALTGRETETLNLIARGYTYEETAQSLSISLSTVQTHVRSIYGKLAVTSRSGAVIEAHRRGLLEKDLFARIGR